MLTQPLKTDRSSTSGVVRVNGVDLFVTDRGEGRCLVLLHGWATSGVVWDRQVAELSMTNRVVTIDWRGCGRSEHPDYGNTIAQVAADIVEVLVALELSEVTIVGSSLGGNLALEVALSAPSRLAEVVLIDAPAHWFTDGLDPDAFEVWIASLSGDRPAVVEAMMPGWFGPHGSEAMRRWTTSLVLGSGPFVDLLLRDAASHDRRQQLPGLDLPLHVLHGELDSEVPLAVAERTAALAASGELTVLEGCGHMPHLERPDLVTAQLRRIVRPPSFEGASS